MGYLSSSVRKVIGNSLKAFSRTSLVIKVWALAKRAVAIWIESGRRNLYSLLILAASLAVSKSTFSTVKFGIDRNSSSNLSNNDFSVLNDNSSVTVRTLVVMCIFFFATVLNNFSDEL